MLCLYASGINVLGIFVFSYICHWNVIHFVLLSWGYVIIVLFFPQIRSTHIFVFSHSTFSFPQLQLMWDLSVKKGFNYFCLSLFIYWLNSSLLWFCHQASGYGSGDDAYDDIEGRDEVKKIVEEREYNVVCTYTWHTRGTLSLYPSHLVGLDLAQRKQLLSSQAWRRVEQWWYMCCSLKGREKQPTGQQGRGQGGKSTRLYFECKL